MLQVLCIPAAYRCVITLAFIGVIIALSVTPDRGQPDDSIFSWFVTNTGTTVQKLLHVACYAAIAMLWAWTLEAIDSRTIRFVLAFVLTIGLGAALEWYQTMVPGRFGTLTDVLLNAAGAVAGLLVALIAL